MEVLWRHTFVTFVGIEIVYRFSVCSNVLCVYARFTLLEKAIRDPAELSYSLKAVNREDCKIVLINASAAKSRKLAPCKIYKQSYATLR